jgi:hypothetical protein
VKAATPACRFRASGQAGSRYGVAEPSALVVSMADPEDHLQGMMRARPVGGRVLRAGRILDRGVEAEWPN